VTDSIYIPLLLLQVQKEPVLLNNDTSVPRLGDANLTVMGFGRTAEVNGVLPDVLNGATLGYVDPDACKQAYAAFPSYIMDADTMLCAAGEGKDRYVFVP
jgi:hypothetical protein